MALTQIQSSRIAKIIDLSDITPSSKLEERNAAVYDQFSDFNIYILENWETGEYSVLTNLTKDGVELTGSSLDSKLNSIEKIQKDKVQQHIPRSPKDSDGKINSITTIANGANQKRIEQSIIKNPSALPVNRRTQIANQAMQEIHSKINELKSEEAIVEFVYYIEMCNHFCAQIARDKHTQLFRDNIAKSERASAIRKDKAKNKENGTSSSKKLSKAEKAMDALGMKSIEDKKRYQEFLKSLGESAIS